MKELCTTCRGTHQTSEQRLNCRASNLFAKWLLIEHLNLKVELAKEFLAIQSETARACIHAYDAFGSDAKEYIRRNLI